MVGIRLRKSDNDDKNDKFCAIGSPWGRGHKTRHGFPSGYPNDGACDESYSSSSLLLLVLLADSNAVALFLVGNGETLVSPPPIGEGSDGPFRGRGRRRGRGRLRDRPALTATVPSLVEERNLLVVAWREAISGEVFTALFPVAMGAVDFADGPHVVDDAVR